MLIALPVFLLSSGILPLLALYRLYWFVLYARGPLLGNGQRVTGRVVSPERVVGQRPVLFGYTGDGELVVRPFLVLHGDEQVLVNPAGALLRGWPRRIRLGDRVTVDGLEEPVALDGEQIYRENGVAPGLSAVQVVRGCPPPLRKLTMFLLGAWLLSLGVLLSGLIF